MINAYLLTSSEMTLLSTSLSSKVITNYKVPDVISFQKSFAYTYLKLWVICGSSNQTIVYGWACAEADGCSDNFSKQVATITLSVVIPFFGVVFITLAISFTAFKRRPDPHTRQIRCVMRDATRKGKCCIKRGRSLEDFIARRRAKAYNKIPQQSQMSMGIEQPSMRAPGGTVEMNSI